MKEAIKLSLFADDMVFTYEKILLTLLSLQKKLLDLINTYNKYAEYKKSVIYLSPLAFIYTIVYSMKEIGKMFYSREIVPKLNI